MLLEANWICAEDTPGSIEGRENHDLALLDECLW
jgi:hypothetical protein